MSAARWGLERIEALAEELGHPEQAFRVFHIAGTNGKGSTASFAASLLASGGHEVGLYTSPHLLDVRERFQISGHLVSEEVLQAAADRVLACGAAREATYFEVTTALGFVCFAEAGVEMAVVETGLGGRLDATNVVRPIGTAITPIGLDHTELLGSSLAAVAAEKAGILKAGTPVAAGRLEPDALEAILARATDVAAPVRRLALDAHIENLRVERTGTSFVYRSSRWPDGLSLRTGLVGAHQADNAGLAVLMVESSLPDLAEGAWQEGILRARLPGRFEVEAFGSRTWVFDIAHNPSGLRTLVETLRKTDLPRPWTVVVSILEDKPWHRMLDVLRLDTDAIILTQAGSAPESRRWDPEAAREHLSRAGDRSLVRVHPDLREALETAAELSPQGTVIVTGSAHTVGDAREVGLQPIG